MSLNLTARQLLNRTPFFGSEAQNLEALALLQAHDPELNARITADCAVVTGEDETWICQVSGKEYADVDNIRHILYYDPEPDVNREFPQYHGLQLGRRGLGVLTVANASLTSDQQRLIRSFEYTYDGDGWLIGWYIRYSMDIGGKDYRSVDACYHATDHTGTDFAQCPRAFMLAVGSHMEYGHETGNLYYCSDDIPYEDTAEYALANCDDDDSDDPRSGYHEARRSWERNWDSVHDWKRLKNRPIRDRKFGVELEIKAKDYDGLRNVCELARDMGFLAEEDGSLDSDLGVEIIAPAFTMAETADPNGQWCKFLKKASRYAICWNAGSVYSMHVSVNRTAMSPATAGKFVNAIHNMNELGVAIAGRNSTNYAQYLPDQSPYHICCGANREETDKFRAASVRSASRIEVRIFRGSLNPVRFIRNVQYCDAVWDWATRCSFSQSKSEDAFLAWLMNENQHQYPLLAQWVVKDYKKQYTLKGKARLPKMGPVPAAVEA